MTQDPSKLNAFPVFVRVEGRVVVIVGNGDEALAKARLMAQSSAAIRLVADQPDHALAAWIAATEVAHVRVPYDASVLDGAVLAFAATGDETLDRRISDDARALSIPVNAVDRPECCDFFTPALVNRAPVAIAIGTEGAGPVLAQLIRARIDQMLSPSLGQLAMLGNSFRDLAEKLLPKGSVRRRFWNDFFSGAPARAMEVGHAEEAREAAAELLLRRTAARGHIALVGAG
ncbi:NAD(P)-dependent oxidoreductase, partial [Rhizobiaceae sp. 2RAB30]